MNEWLVSNNDGFTPILERRALERLGRYGFIEKFRSGDILIAQGEPYERCIAVLDGTVVVEQATQAGTWPIKRLNKGEFVGEVNTLSGRPSRITGRAATDGSIISLDRPALQSLMEAERELGEIIMGAFILRHLYLLARGSGDVAILGSSASGDTSRLRALLSRNGYSHLFLDLEAEPDIGTLLKMFGIKPNELPVLIHRQVLILRNPTSEAVTALLGFDGQQI